MACRSLRIGIFFDGTGNSRRDVERFSNVAKLYDMYLTLEDEDFGKPKLKTTSFKCYCVGVGEGRKKEPLIETVGKRGRKKDVVCNKDEGAVELATGAKGAERVYRMIDAVCDILDAHPYHSSDDSRFRFREIDLFGFSRGAALARDFVNTFYWKIVNKDRKNYGDVRFNFIGLFDTVGSFGIAGNDIDMKPREEFYKEVNEGTGFYEGALEHILFKGDSLEHIDGEIVYQEIFKDKNRAQNRAKELRRYWGSVDIELYYPPSLSPIYYPLYKVVAKDEATDIYEPYNFNLDPQQYKKCLHLIAHNEVRKNFPLFNADNASEEIAMIGVHSDVGGGYEPKDKEVLIMPVNEKTKERVESMLAYGWKHPGLIKNRSILKKDRVVDNSLAKASLFKMHKEALKHNVPLEEELSIFVEGELKEYIEHIGHGLKPLDFPNREYIVEYHAHQSATHPTVGGYYDYPLRVSENYKESLALSNVANLKDKKVERDVYQNSIGRAVKPKSL